MIAPASLEELAEAVRATPRLLPVGSRTKRRLGDVDAPLLTTRQLSGIVEYDPGEFTFTALAGTPLRQIVAALAAQSQYLPFDPPFVGAGSTLGGAVAAGLSGPGRFRFGGVRDFILGVRFVDGLGRLLRMGGKVVKNSAGFDLPKFFVGSLGRFGVLGELTFKVFPRPASTRTLKLIFDGIDDAAGALVAAANTRWEADALELLPDARSVLLRLAGPEPALEAISREILARWRGTTLAPDEAATTWMHLREFDWADRNDVLLKVPVTAAQLPVLHRSLSSQADVRIHASGGGDVAYISCAESPTLDETLGELGLRGLRLRGHGPLWCGIQTEIKIARAVKEALDPEGRFPGLSN